MNRKRIILNILVIIAALAVFVYWNENSRKEAALKASSPVSYRQANTSETNPIYKIYLITNEKKPQFWQYVNQGVSDMADLLGLTYTWDASENQDIEQQINIVNNAVENGADAILISPLDAERLAEPIRQAIAKGVKVIYLNSATYEKAITTLATKNYEAGKIAAENMLEELELLNQQKGEIGIVSIVETNPTITERDKGFMDAIKADGRFTLLDRVFSGGDPKIAEELAGLIIKEHQNLVGLFGSNEGASIGVGNAIKANDKRIVGVGFDKSDATMRLLENDDLKVIIAQNPYTMGYLGMAEAYAALKGFNTGPPFINTGVSVIRKR